MSEIDKFIYLLHKWFKFEHLNQIVVGSVCSTYVWLYFKKPTIYCKNILLNTGESNNEFD